MNHEGDCRTAPATPGLLITKTFLTALRSTIRPDVGQSAYPIYPVVIVLTNVKVETVLTVVTVGLIHNLLHESRCQLVGW